MNSVGPLWVPASESFLSRAMPEADILANIHSYAEKSESLQWNPYCSMMSSMPTSLGGSAADIRQPLDYLEIFLNESYQATSLDLNTTNESLEIIDLTACDDNLKQKNQLPVLKTEVPVLKTEVRILQNSSFRSNDFSTINNEPDPCNQSKTPIVNVMVSKPEIFKFSFIRHINVLYSQLV